MRRHPAAKEAISLLALILVVALALRIFCSAAVLSAESRLLGNTVEKWGYYFLIDAEAAADGVVVIFLYSALA